MTKRLISIVVGLIVASGMFVQGQSDSSASRQGRFARVKALRPSAGTDMVMNEVIVTTDEAGRARVLMNGPMPKGRAERFFWLVDRSGGEYWVLKLTGNLMSDAARIQNIYRQLDVEISAERLAFDLLPESERQRGLREAFEAGVRVAPAAAPVPHPTGQLGFQIRPARSINEGSHRLGLIRSGTSGASGGADALRSVSPRPSPLARRAREYGLRLAQHWSYGCNGLGAVNVQTWEPAKLLFPVDHLNETSAQASYGLWNGSVTYVNRSGYCWANPTTFANTHWYEEGGCPESFTQQSDYFDYARTGLYINHDFIEKFFSVPPDPNEWVGIVSTAAVQYTNGGPHLGYEYYEIGTPLGMFWPSWLLGGVILSGSYEGCDYYCVPDQWMIDECEILGGAWDYEICDCRMGSPILIDLNRDGLALTDAVSGVTFDLFANGMPVQVAWTQAGADDAFLVLDRNGNGLIDDGSELFGSNTPQPTATAPRRKQKRAPNGFLALAVYDELSQGGNSDGLITEEDKVHSKLRLWADVNHNGVSEPAEIATLQDVGIRSISLRYIVGKKVDEFGNLYGLRSHVIMDRDVSDPRPLQRRAVDVFFSFIPFGSTGTVTAGSRTL